MSEQPAPNFSYSNLNGRRTGVFYRTAALLLPGVRKVQAQIIPYAQAWQRANLAALSAPGPLWVALGDSMSQGIGASAYDQGWVGQLGRQLTRDGEPYRIVNLSVSGARVADVTDRQLPAMEQLGVRPDLVTVLIGSNDMVRRKYRDALPGAVGDLLRRLPPGTYIASLPNGQQVAAAVNALIDQSVAQRQLVAVDMRSRGPVSWKGRLAEDHFHPNDLGYAAMAKAFASAITDR